MQHASPVSTKRGPTETQKPGGALVAAAAPAGAKAAEPDEGHALVIRSRDDDSALTPLDFDPKRFDALAWLPKAEALARARMSDAVLTMFDVDGVHPDGHVDLTLSPSFEARYFFRSPSRSVLNPQLPDDAQEVRCVTHVVVTAKHVDTYTTTSTRACREPPLPRWRCPLVEAMRGAVAQSGKADKVATVEWLKTEWYVTYNASESSYSVPCP